MPTIPTVSTICADFHPPAPSARSVSRRANVAGHVSPLQLLLRDTAGQQLSADCQRTPHNAGVSRFTIKGRGGAIEALPVSPAHHGDIDSLGFRFGGLAYSSDLKSISRMTSLLALADLDVWIIDALRYKPHPSHFSVDRGAGLDRPDGAQTGDPDQPAFRSRLRRIARSGCRATVVPAYDGMQIQLSSTGQFPG